MVGARLFTDCEGLSALSIRAAKRVLKHLTYKYGVNMIMPHLCTVGSTGGRVVCPIDDSLNNRSDGWTLAQRNHLERGSDEKALPH